MDLDCLKTLPPRELASGLAKSSNTALFLTVRFLTGWKRTGCVVASGRSGNGVLYSPLLELKAEVVAADERETGLRALLIWDIPLVMPLKLKWGMAIGSR